MKRTIQILKATILTACATFMIGAAPAALASTSTSASDTGTCGDSKTEFIRCEESSGLGSIGALIKIAIFVVTVIIGIAAVGGLAYAAVIYASARDNSGQVGQAKDIIRNVVVGLILYGFAVALINWLVPGGVIG